MQFLQLLASYYKEERFKGEGEIRAAFLPIYKDNKLVTNISYFEQDNGILRPYIDVRFLHKSKSSEGEESYFKVECPIKSILIGPSGNQQKVYNSVVHRLKYGEVRGWKYNYKQLSKIVSEYILGCIRENSLDYPDYIGVVNSLCMNWCKANDYNYHIERATEADVTINIVDGSENINNDHSITEEAKRICEKYMENNYLSSQGIWVKKSSLPYNF